MKSHLSKPMRGLTLLTLLLGCLTVLLLLLCRFLSAPWVVPAYITALTTFYHFAMRLTVGSAVTVLCRRKLNANSFLFRIRSFEPGLYRLLKVRKWKAKVLTAKPEQFDLHLVSPDALMQNMLRAELVHRVIMVLSFLPLLLIIPYGEPVVFLLTSVLACLFDGIFVIIQRFNRPRVAKLLNRHTGKES